MDSSAIDIFNILIIAFGAYIIYAAIILKKDGKISKSLMLSPGANDSTIKNKDGFIKFMFTRTVILGIVVTLSGCWDIVFPQLAGNGWIELTIILVFMLILVLYIRDIKKAGKVFGEQK